MAGSAAAADLIGHIKDLAFSSAFLAGLDLVFAFSDKARDHEFLYRQFSQLVADIRAKPALSETDLREWEIRKTEIDANEPAAFWALEALCYNEAIYATDRNQESRRVIRFYERLLKNCIRFSSSTFEPGARPYFSGLRSRFQQRDQKP